MDGAQHMEKGMEVPGVWRRNALLEPRLQPDCVSASSAPAGGVSAVSSLQVSVVVPTCGRIDLLQRCLEALVVQEIAPTAFEIIVVDDRPGQATRNVVYQSAARMADKQLSIFYVANSGAHGPAAARNRGWKIAHSPIIAFTDDDTIPAGDWLKNGLAAFGNDVDAVRGCIQMPLPANPTDYQRDAQLLETAEFVTANCFCRKKVLETLNGFDERFRLAWREDSDFHFRLLGCNAVIVHAPQAVVVHPVRLEAWGVSVFQQKKILFDALLYKKHPLLYRQKIRAKPRWDYYLVVAALMAGLTGFASGNYLVAAMAASVWLLMTARLCWSRLRYTAKTWSHIIEMVVTSAIIPVLAVFWRLVGAVRFRAGLI